MADIWAAALWSALGFQPALPDAKREALRAEVLNAARIWSMRQAESARVRVTVKDFEEFVVTGEADGGSGAFKRATLDTIDALRNNATLDREELDFLWWALLGRSRVLGRTLGAISEPTRIIAMGIEAAELLRRFPAEVHRDIVLRTLDANPSMRLADLIQNIGDDAPALRGVFDNDVVKRNPSVFPLLCAIVGGAAPPNGAMLTRNVEEWGGRALLEAALVKLETEGNR